MTFRPDQASEGVCTCLDNNEIYARNSDIRRSLLNTKPHLKIFQVFFDQCVNMLPGCLDLVIADLAVVLTILKRMTYLKHYSRPLYIGIVNIITF